MGLPTRAIDAAEQQAAALTSIAADIHAAAERFSSACRAVEQGIAKATATERRSIRAMKKRVDKLDAEVAALEARFKGV